METPRVTEVQNRRLRPLLDEVADAESRKLSRSMWADVDGTDPLADVTFDVPAVLRDHHDYPSEDVWFALELREMV